MTDNGSFYPKFSDWFWEVINQLHANPDSADEVFDKMSKEHLIQFYHEFREATDELLPGISEEKSELVESEVYEVCCWVVAQGRDFYMTVWDAPSLASNPTSVPFHNYAGFAADVCKKKYGKELLG